MKAILVQESRETAAQKDIGKYNTLLYTLKDYSTDFQCCAANLVPVYHDRLSRLCTFSVSGVPLVD